MNSAYLKLLAGGFLYGLWAALVFTEKADALPLVAAIGTGITSLLGYHAITTLQSPQQVAQLVAQLTQQIQSGSAGSVASQKLPTVPLKELS